MATDLKVNGASRSTPTMLVDKAMRSCATPIGSLTSSGPSSQNRPRGEGSQGPAAAAIANAFANATGRRLRELPFTPDRVKAALA